MVQRSPSPTLDVTPSPEHSQDSGERQEEPVMVDNPKMDSPGCLQLSLDVSTAYYGYETYIDDGLICLRHKVRNLEKKKLKLEDYKKRLNQGEALNKDQMAAVEKYEEVLHNLVFARDLHKTLDNLTQSGRISDGRGTLCSIDSCKRHDPTGIAQEINAFIVKPFYCNHSFI